MLRWGRLEVTGGFCLAAAALFYLDTENILPWALLACALHELGHYAVTRLAGGGVAYFRLTAVGGDLGLDPARPLGYAGEMAAILAGPTVNLLRLAVRPAGRRGRDGASVRGPQSRAGLL